MNYIYLEAKKRHNSAFCLGKGVGEYHTECFPLKAYTLIRITKGVSLNDFLQSILILRITKRMISAIEVSCLFFT